ARTETVQRQCLGGGTSARTYPDGFRAPVPTVHRADGGHARACTFDSGTTEPLVSITAAACWRGTGCNIVTRLRARAGTETNGSYQNDGWASSYSKPR